MARTGVGGRRGRRRLSSNRFSNEYGDDHFNADNSDVNSCSSGYDDVGLLSRDRNLDDALFGFFREQSLKSLKRNFTDFCKDRGLSPSNKDKRCRIDGVDRTVFTRYSLKYFMGVLRKLTPEQKAVIEKFGFGCLLLLDIHDIPSEFCRWVADCVDPVCSQITVKCRLFDISKRTVHFILGLPIGGLIIPCNSQEGEDFILGHFNLSAMPHITFFGNKLSGPDVLSDHDVFVCFLIIALHCFLCPNLEEHISGSYLSVLKQPETAREYDFSKLVYDHCLTNIGEFIMMGKIKGRRLRAPLCCNYVPVVRYLDCLDFGRKNVEESFPRVAVWRGNMIKFFSELDRKRRNRYGKRELKEDFARCRTDDVKLKQIKSPPFHPLPSDFRRNVETSFASSLRADVIEGIVNVAEKFASNKFTTNKPRIELLVKDVLEFLCKSTFTQISAATTHLAPGVLNNGLAANLCANGNKAGSGEFVQSPAAKLDINVASEPVTPDCFITKVVEASTFLTAPEMNPVKKVMSKRFQVVSDLEEVQFTLQPPCPVSNNYNSMNANPAKPPHQSVSKNVNTLGPKFSPVGTINLPDSPCDMPSTGYYKIKRVQPVAQPGSKQVPILLPDGSPKICADGNVQNILLVGSNDFRRRSSELAKKVDSTYNKLISNQHDGNGDVALQGRAKDEQPEEQTVVRRARRKHRFVNLLMTCQNPPLQQNRRFPVSDEDIIHYSAIIELGHSLEHRGTQGVMYPEVHCNYRSLGESLMPGGEVDNFLITCFCRLLFKEKHPSASGRHYFFPLIGECILKYQEFPNEDLMRTTFEGAAKASKGRKLGHKDNRLFFPITDSGHWFVFTVDFEYKLFAFGDSLHDKNSHFHVKRKDLLIDNFKHIWELVFNTQNTFDNFRAMYPHVPKQDNTLDCGVYCMKFMETWKPFIDLRKLFSYLDILNIRIQYAMKLYFMSQNETDLSLVMDYYSKG